MSVYDLWYLFFYVFSTNLYPTWSTGYGHHCSMCAAVIGPISFSSRWSIKFYLIIKAVRSAIISHLRCNLSSCSNLHEASGGSKSITGCLWFLYRIQSFIPSHLSCLHPIYLTLILPIMHKYIRQTLWNVSLSSWSIRLVPGAPSSIEVSIWKYHCDPDINQWAPRGGEGRTGAPKIINETDRPAVSLGQSVSIRAFPPVAAGAESRVASKFNTRRRSCELEAQKDTLERGYVPRLIIRAVSFSPYMCPPLLLLLLPVYLWSFFSLLYFAIKKHITPLIEQQWLQIKFLLFIRRLMGYFPEHPPPPPPPPSLPPHNLWSLVKPISSCNFKLWEGKVELDINEKRLQMLVSGIHLTVSAGLKRRLAADTQTLTQSIRATLRASPPLPGYSRAVPDG